MNCKRCGRSNPPNARRCMYCNTPFYSNNNLRSNNGHRNKKQNNQSDKIIFGAIIALVLILVTMAGIYAFQNFAPRKRGFSGGGGGAIVSSSTGSNNNGSFSLEATKHELEVGTSDNVVYFYARPKGTATKVELTDDEGNVIVEMKDDGLYSESGDDLTNDGVYTAKVSVDVTQAQVLFYSAIVNSNKSSKSNVEKICVIAPFTDSELSEINKVNESIRKVKESDNYKQMSIDERRKAILEELTKLSEQGLIVADSIYDDTKNNVITYYLKCGVMAVQTLEDEDYTISGLSTKRLPNKLSNDSFELYNNKKNMTQTSLADVGVATIYYALGDTANPTWKAYYDSYEYIRNEWNDCGLKTAIDNDVTIEDMKKVDQNNVVYMAAHGGYMTFTYKYDFKYFWFFEIGSKKKSITIPGVVFLEKSTKNKNKQYSLDLKTGRAFLHDDCYGIAPAFFEGHYDNDDFENLIMLWGSCQLMGNNGTVCEDWPNALNNTGLKAFIGFHNSVYTYYHCEVYLNIVRDLAEGKTIKDSLDIALATYGNNDISWYNNGSNNKFSQDSMWNRFVNTHPNVTQPKAEEAYPLLRGDKNATLINNELINGNFEANPAVIKGWKKTGDVRLLTKLGEVMPKEGSQMTILTTGIGSGQSTYLNSTEGSSLYQAVRLGNKLKLSFDYNIISEEPEEYVGSQYDDKFYAEILNAKGEVIKTIASETVNNSTWSPVADINFEGGDDTVYQTGWKNIECDLSDLKGQIVTIRFAVFDVGDSKFDTAAVVDNVVLK